MMKERVAYLDYIRILACCMIIFIHAPKASDSENSLFLSSLSFFLNPGIGLFFMVSGALLLPAKEDTLAFVKRKLLKFAYPVVFWSLVYLVIGIDHDVSFYQLTRSLISIPFTPQGNGVLWFMYALIALYIVTPILSRWLITSTKRELELYLSLWIVSLCYPILEFVVFVNESNTGILYYCSGYIGYFLLGYYLNKYWVSFKLVALLFILTIFIPVVLKLNEVEVDFYRMFWCLSVFSMIQCVFWFVGVKRFIEKKIFVKYKDFIILFANLTFGIYLVHILVLKNIFWKLTFIVKADNYIIESLFTALLTLVLSFIISYLISFFPISNYIIGFKQKRIK